MMMCLPKALQVIKLTFLIATMVQASDVQRGNIDTNVLMNGKRSMRIPRRLVFVPSRLVESGRQRWDLSDSAEGKILAVAELATCFAHYNRLKAEMGVLADRNLIGKCLPLYGMF
jgi:hypothetical protein